MALSTVSSSSALDPLHRDWNIGLEEALGTIQYLAYDPHKEFPLFGFDFHSDSILTTLLSEAHKQIAELRYNDALSTLQKVQVRESGLAAALNMQGYAHFMLKNYDLATNSLQEALSETNGNAMLWHAKGAVYLTQGSFREAAECFERAISHSFFEKTNPMQHWLHLGLASYYTRDFSKTIQSIQAALKLSPEDYRPYPLLARALHAAGELDRSIEVFDAYLALARAEWIYYLKASVLLEQGKNEFVYFLTIYVAVADFRHSETIRLCNLIREPRLRDAADEFIVKARENLGNLRTDEEKAQTDAVLDRYLPARASPLVRPINIGNLIASPRLNSNNSSPRDRDGGSTSSATDLGRRSGKESPRVARKGLPSPSQTSSSSAMRLSQSAPDSKSPKNSIGTRVTRLFSSKKARETKEASSPKALTKSDSKRKKKNGGDFDPATIEEEVHERTFTLEEVVNDELLDELFNAIVAEVHCEENYAFYKECREYCLLEDSGERQLSAITINRKYVEHGSAQEVNLTDDVRSFVLENAKSGKEGVYDEAVKAAQDLLVPYLPLLSQKVFELEVGEREANSKVTKSKVSGKKKRSNSITRGSVGETSPSESIKGKKKGSNSSLHVSTPLSSPKVVKSSPGSQRVFFGEVPRMSLSAHPSKEDFGPTVIHAIPAPAEKNQDVSDPARLSPSSKSSPPRSPRSVKDFLQQRSHDHEKPRSERSTVEESLPSHQRTFSPDALDEAHLLLQSITDDPAYYAVFMEVLAGDHMDGYLRFYNQCSTYGNLNAVDARKSTATEICDAFLSSNAQWPLELTPLLAVDVARGLDTCSADLFKSASEFALLKLLSHMKNFNAYYDV